MMYLKGYLMPKTNSRERDVAHREASFGEATSSPKYFTSGSPLKEKNLIFIPEHQKNMKNNQSLKGVGARDKISSESWLAERPPRMQDTRAGEADESYAKKNTSTRRRMRKKSKKENNSMNMLKTHQRYTSSERPCCQGQRSTEHSQVLIPKNGSASNLDLSERKRNKRRSNSRRRSHSRGQQEGKDTQGELNKFVVLEQISASQVRSETSFDLEVKLRNLEKINRCLTDRIRTLEKERDVGMANVLETSSNYKNTGKCEGCLQRQNPSEEVLLLSQELRKRDSEIESLRALNKSYSDRLQDQEESSGREISRLRQIIGSLEGLSIEQDEKLRAVFEETENHIRSERSAKLYKEQIEELNVKVRGLQKELRGMAEQEGKIEALKQELIRRENEFEELKRSYARKLEKRKDTETRQKREWGLIYNELLGEIRCLKGDLDSLSVENKCIGLNQEGFSRRSKGMLSLKKDLSQEFSVQSSTSRLPMKDYYY